MILLQMSIVLLIFSTICGAIPAAPSKSDKTTNHLKFQYGYEIAGPSGGQVREEQRDGVYALGRYYVLGGNANQKVEYLADNWGYHPYVEYSNVGPHSKSSTQIAHGAEAVNALHNSRSNNKNVFDNIKLQPTTLKLHRVPLVDTLKLQPKKTSKPLNVVVPSSHRPKELNQMPLQSQPSQYYPTKQQEVPKYHHQQPQYILEPPPEPQSNQIPVYFIQSGYTNPQHQQNYLYPAPPSTLQTTILVPVKNQPEFVRTYSQPTQMYFDGIQPSALPLIYEPPPPQAVVPLALPPINHHAVVLENIQDNIKNQLLNEQDLERQRIEQLYGNKIHAKLTLQQTNEKLIENTRQLVTAQDVININESLEDKRAADLVPSAYYVTTAHPPKLSENPIVVPDNNLIEAEQSNLQIAEDNGTSSALIATEPTILVTPRPQLGTNHLAPINAAIQLQSVALPTVASPSKQNVIVEIQKSVPYYLGKFEFVQDANQVRSVAARTKQKYDISAETAENFELGKTILSSFDNFEVSSSKEPFQDNSNNLDQHQASGQIQYQVVPAQNLVRNNINKPSVIPIIMVEPSPHPSPILEPTEITKPQYAQTTACDHQYHRGVTYLHKVPDTTPRQITNDVFPAAKPFGTILHYQQQRINSSPFYNTIDLHGSATGDSAGLVPPMADQVVVPFFRSQQAVRGVYQPPVHQIGGPKKYRHARQSFEGNLRIEYGFMPPLVPSVEIDEHGKPIEKRDI